MSKLISLLFFVVAFTAGNVKAETDYELKLLKLSSENPYRRVEGKVYDLSALFQYLILQHQMTLDEMRADTTVRPTPRWKYGEFKMVQDLGDDGVLAMIEGSLDFLNGKVVRMKNYPGAKYLTDGSSFHCYYTESGNYSYIATSGANKRVESYDYGEVMTPAEFRAYLESLRPKTRAKPLTNSPTIATNSKPQNPKTPYFLD